MISVIIVSMMVLSVYSIDTFSRNQVLNSDRRVKVQNDLANALEHMSKYVQQASGNLNDPGISQALGAGFQVRVDFKGTPSDYTDDSWIRYWSFGNTLAVRCVKISGTSICPSTFKPPLFIIYLSYQIRSGVVNNAILPDPLPANPSGFYVRLEDNASSINVGLVGRYLPTQPVSISNPQVSMKTKLICNSCSAN